MTDTQAAWVAGIVDGEGCIGIFKARKSYRLTLAVSMTHKPTIERLKSLLKVGSITHNKSASSKWKDSWSLHISGEDAVAVIRRLLPYLFTKRAQADLAIEYGEKCLHERRVGEWVSEEKELLRAVLAEEMQELNKRGPDVEVS